MLLFSIAFISSTITLAHGLERSFIAHLSGDQEAEAVDTQGRGQAVFHLTEDGTEVNQQPGVGTDQPPRQAGPNTGADEGGPVQLVNDGYTYPETSESIRVTITVVPPPTPEPPDQENVFLMELSAGLNMISLPLKPMEPLTARSFAEAMDATMVIRYDTQGRKFSGFTPSMDSDGFAIEGGQGYIINKLMPGVVAFVGAAWTNEPFAEAAPPAAERSSAWAFVVSGKLDPASSERGSSQLYTVIARNMRTGEMAKDSIADDRRLTVSD